ncbi:hypothetical protein CIPAW_05G003100 [Carya illinoinensis]|uniref:Uncharacterized protein n=1 Tax=Carya illinoinensis TaxID=32201 RepID=A0A8T1QDS6_CARIL|nr:hypothetical protein CIPAW_05G003100 [Carya illinoinensis]
MKQNSGWWISKLGLLLEFGGVGRSLRLCWLRYFGDTCMQKRAWPC